ncbi:MAG: 6-phosphofructokinase [Acidobacteria bacterium]|nr:MAG: 6-phosphofructokinase [Acidobacteriota bacterium]
MADKLTGNLLVGQSGGPTAVINSSLCGVVQEAMKHEQIQGIYGAVHGVEGILKEQMIDLRQESAETIDLLRQTPSAALGSCRRKLKESDYGRILGIFQKYNIRYFHYIGGNDSQDSSYQISKLATDRGYELRVIGVPKTVDNDLDVTDHSPGYGSVARFIAIATRDAGLDTEAIGVVDTVKIIETMGRNAGWITAGAALAKEEPDDAPHLVYVPERTLDLDQFLSDVQRVYDRLGYAVVAVCEGLKNKKGESIVASGSAIDTDSFGHKQHGGVGDFLCDVIKNKIQLKARCDKPATIQRVSMIAASSVDLAEAYQVGVVAVREAVAGKTDFMVTLVRQPGKTYSCTTGLATLVDAANKEKKLPDHFINPEGNGLTEAFLDYARPLIGGPLPRYARLKKRLVKREG